MSRRFSGNYLGHLFFRGHALTFSSLASKCFIVFNVLLLLLLSGCSSTISSNITFVPERYDKQFDGFESVQLVEEEQIFLLNEQSINYVKERAALAETTDDKALTLIADLFSPSQLALDYVYAANSVAQDTFENGKANCLSLTILAYSMAQQAGLNVVFQEVIQEESWNQMGEFELANGHVNLLISKKSRYSSLPSMPSIKRNYTVDFFPEGRGKKAKTREISKAAITSFFYSNTGADELIKGNLTAAYANFRKALQLNPKDSSAWSNLGIVLARHNQFELASEVYDIAIQLKPKNYTAWDNVMALHKRLGNDDRVNEIQHMLANVRSDNPNYFLRMGERHFINGDIEEAEKALRKSLRLAPKNHYAWHALAKVNMQKGDLEAVKLNLERARKYANQRGFERRYGQKLVALASYKQ